MPSLAAVCSIVILGYGGSLVLSGEITVGTFTAFFMYVNMVVQPFRVAGFIVNLFQRAAVASDRSVRSVRSRAGDRRSRRPARRPRRSAARSNSGILSFAYDATREPALNDVSLTVRRGESITIMGRVGAGKTTLLKLLVRLLDPPPGTVFVDGHDVRDYPLVATALADRVGAAGSVSVRRAAARQPDVRRSRARARPDLGSRGIGRLQGHRRRISREQLETIVGERGVTLSGGQKQRATLARGLIRQAPVLMLDDCFSSVDTETEEHILSELKRLRRGQTTLLISHRVSTARHSDRIVVLDEGRIVEAGSHLELLARGGIYAELERIQREGADASDYATAEEHA